MADVLEVIARLRSWRRTDRTGSPFPGSGVLVTWPGEVDADAPDCDRYCYPGSIPGSIIFMKVSVSLPEDDIEFLDAYASEQGIGSRSAVVHKAVGLLRAVELSDDYQQAWTDWSASEDDALWDAPLADGVSS